MASQKKSTKEKVQKKKKRLVLLDAHAIIHRAYHALPDFTSAKGEPTGALYGLSTMLLKMIHDLKPEYVVACYDLPEPTYRHEVYDGYKATRKPLDDELSFQLNRSKDVFIAFGIPIYEKPGFEADDLLGTIVEKTRNEKDLEVVIASGDMDTLQLVEGKRVQVYTLKKGIQDTVLYDEEAVLARFGFSPTRIPDYKGLRGDPSDNIIGIPGIGEKTATELITRFGNIEDLYAQLGKDPSVFKKAGIKERIVELLKTHEEDARFSKMLASIRRDAPIQFVVPEPWNKQFEPEKALALFQELGFKSLSVRIKEFAGATSVEGEGGAGAELEVSPKVVLPREELRALALGVSLLDSEQSNPTWDDVRLFLKVEDPAQAREALREALTKEKLLSVYEEIELPLIPVIEAMEKRGVLVDQEFLKALGSEYHAELSKIEAQIFSHAGISFNVNSPKQLGEVLFDKLGLAPKNIKKTGTGQRSTRESELEKMRELHPIIDEIVKYRELQKLLGTYIDTIPSMLDGAGRLHTTFLQIGASTGRMSSQNPNLQNIPIRTDLGKRIRNAFVASPGYVMAALDYSQIELRVAAFLSDDAKLIEIFKEGGDIHQAVAREVFGVPPELVDREMRRRAKIINFGILYGMGVNALKAQLGTSREEAQRFYQEYFKNFSGLATYLERVKADAKRKGYTETFFGRKRFLEGLRSSLPYVQAQAERMAINAPIQGTQADIIKIAMRKAFEYFAEAGLQKDAYLLLQVHDELVFEIKQEKADQVVRDLKRIMESVLPTEKTKGIPLLVEASVGRSWGELSKVSFLA